MDEARLTEIEEKSKWFTNAGDAEYLGVPELIAEVRRLQGEVEWLRAEGANLLLKFGRQIPNGPPQN